MSKSCFSILCLLLLSACGFSKTTPFATGYAYQNGTDAAPFHEKHDLVIDKEFDTPEIQKIVQQFQKPVTELLNVIEGQHGKVQEYVFLQSRSQGVAHQASPLLTGFEYALRHEMLQRGYKIDTANPSETEDSAKIPYILYYDVNPNRNIVTMRHGAETDLAVWTTEQKSQRPPAVDRGYVLNQDEAYFLLSLAQTDGKEITPISVATGLYQIDHAWDLNQHHRFLSPIAGIRRNLADENGDDYDIKR